MSWKLTTPVSAGDLDPTLYDRVDITRWEPNNTRKSIYIFWSLGYIQDGKFVQGLNPVGFTNSVRMTSGEYMIFVSTAAPKVLTSDPGSIYYFESNGVWVELGFPMVKRELYEWLAANGHIGPGVVV